MSICSLNDNRVTGLDTLTGRVTIDTLAGVLETHLEIILILFLTHALKPVVDLKLTASLTIGAVHLASLSTLYNTSA
jgi:hypothetical protein